MSDLPRESGRFIEGYHYSPDTQFHLGERTSPQTEIQRGEHLSPQTEFLPGQTAHNKVEVGTVSVRRETHTGLMRAWIKIAEPNVWQKRSIVVWEHANNCALPRGYVVHHKDRDSLNDDPRNLQALTKCQHINEHRSELK